MSDGLALVRDIFEFHLPQFEVATASSGAEALRSVAEDPPDVILLDVMMPEMDGFEVCRRLKADRTTAHLPVLLLSGAMVDTMDRVKGLELGGDGYLCKPYESEELVAQVQALLRLKQAQDILRDQEAKLQARLELRTEDLRESEARFRSIFELSPDAIFVENAAGLVIDANPAACALHAMTREQLIGTNARDLVPPESIDEVETRFGEWFSGHRIYHEGLSRVGPGQDVPVEIRGSQIVYNGEDAVLLQVRNVSRRHRVEEAIRELAQGVSSDTGMSFFYGLVQRLTEALNVEYAFIGELDVEQSGHIRTTAVYARGEIGDDFSYALEGTPCAEVFQGKSCILPEKAQSLFPDDPLFKKFDIESFLGIPLRDATGQPLGLIAVMDAKPLSEPAFAESIVNIFASRAAAELDRKKAAEELWESEERYRSLSDDVLDTSSIGLVILDAEFNAVWSNQTLETYLGLTKEDTAGRTAQEIVREWVPQLFDEPENLAETILEHFRNGTFAEGMPCHVLPGDNREERWLEYRSTPIKSGLYVGGRIEHFIDITELKNLENQLLQAQKMESIGRLAGGIAHDFNNLLTSILGFSRLLLDELEDGPLGRDVREIINAGERAATLTRQLLAVGRRQILEVRPVNLNAIVTDMTHLLRRTLGEDVELKAMLEHNLPIMDADVGQLEQVLMNLAVNARDAMPNGGRLTIRTASTRGRDGQPLILLSFADTGTGMSKEVRDHAFEPFFTTKAVGKGTGLGLSTVYGIVQQLGGDVTIGDEIGGGCEILITFPMTENPEAVGVADVSEPSLPGGKETILLVEDEDSVRHLTMRLLRNSGYDVIPARDGHEALNICRQREHPVDLLLTDVVMPRLNGPRLVHLARELWPDLRVLYISGFTEENLPVEQEAADLLPKPYTREALLRKVRDVLDGRQG